MNLSLFFETIPIRTRGPGLHTCAQAAFIWAPGMVRRHPEMTDNELLACDVALGHLDEQAAENSLPARRMPVAELARFCGFD